MNELENYLKQLNIAYKIYEITKIFETAYFNVRIRKLRRKTIYDVFNKRNYTVFSSASFDDIKKTMKKHNTFGNFK